MSVYVVRINVEDAAALDGTTPLDLSTATVTRSQPGTQNEELQLIDVTVPAGIAFGLFDPGELINRQQDTHLLSGCTVINTAASHSVGSEVRLRSPTNGAVIAERSIINLASPPATGVVAAVSDIVPVDHKLAFDTVADGAAGPHLIQLRLASLDASDIVDLTSALAAASSATSIEDCVRWVGPPGSDCPFTSIQKAIDDAVADGAGPATPAAILVLPGTYVEDVTMAPGIEMTGMCSALPPGNAVSESCRIVGTVTADLTTAAPFGENRASMSGIDIVPTSGPALVFEGAVLQIFQVSNATLISVDDDTVQMTNTGTDGTNLSRLQWDNVSANALTGNPALVLDQDAGQFQGNRFQLIHDDGVVASALAVEVSGDSHFVGSLDGNITGGISFTSPAAPAGNGHTLLDLFVDCGAQAAIDMTAVGVLVIAEDLNISKATPGLAVTGVAGTILGYNNIRYLGAGNGIDTTLTTLAFVSDGIVPTPTPVVTVPAYTARGFEIVRVATAGPPLTSVVTLPPPTLGPGSPVIVKDFAGVTGVAYGAGEGLSVMPSGGATIDGGPGPFLFTTHRQARTFIFDGTSDWMIVPEG